MTDTLITTIDETIRQHELLAQGAGVIVAVSGGPDSLALLAILRELAPSQGWRLHVAHLDHGLRGAESAREAELVTRLADSWGLGATVERRNVREQLAASGQGLLAAAREVRYRFLADVALAQGAAAVAVAHQAEDQAETLLQRLIRGAGPEGLAAMRALVPWQEWRVLAGHPAQPAGPALIRPLLDIPRAQLEALCAELGLTPASDPSNSSPRYLRSRIRHELLPSLRQLNPRVVEALGRTARLAAQQAADLQLLLDQAWPALASPHWAGLRLSRSGWNSLLPSLRRLALRRAIALARPYAALDAAQIDRALQAIEQRRRELELPLELRLINDEQEILLLDDRRRPALAAALPQPLPGATSLPDGWQVMASLLQAKPSSERIWSATLDAEAIVPPLELRPRRPGERITLREGGPARRISDLMLEQRLPKSWRDQWPLLADQQGVIWIPGVAVAARTHPKPQADTYLLIELQQETADG